MSDEVLRATSVDFLPLKMRAEYEPEDVPKSIVTKAVRAATEVVAIAQGVVAAT